MVHLFFTGKLCIEVTSAAKIAFISEELCIGCGICVKVVNYSEFNDTIILLLFVKCPKVITFILFDAEMPF